MKRCTGRGGRSCTSFSAERFGSGVVGLVLASFGVAFGIRRSQFSDQIWQIWEIFEHFDC